MNFSKWFKQMVNSLYVIVGVVLIWRGAWALLDIFEYRFFGEMHIGFSIVLIIAGVGFLYIHNHKYDKMDHF